MHIVEMDEKPRAWKEINIRDIRILANIGKGSFGVVYKAIWKNREVAVKRVESESEVAALHNEIQQLSRTCHENIIKVLGAYVEGPSHLLVMEFADGGSLYQLLHNPPYPPYTLAHALSWLLQCAKAVAYLHAIEPGPIIHRDLKPPNLLLSDGCRLLKVCDFGTACDLHTVMTDNTGSAAWMAPEVFETKRYTEKCDVYSWGIILWEVLTRRVPFLELGQAYRIMWAVHTKRRPPLIVGCPKLLENLMKRCWDHAASKRPSMEEVVATVPHIARFLRGADEPIQFPSPTDTGSSYMSPTTGASSSERSEEVGDAPSALSSSTFVAPDSGDTSDQSSLHPSLAGPPDAQDSERLVTYDQYWKFPVNQQAWMMPEFALDDSDAARRARRQQIEEDMKCFPPPPAGHPAHSTAFISPNATANIVVSPENLISPCSTLRSEECMEPYKPPLSGPGEAAVLPPIPTSRPQPLGGQSSNNWVPVGSYQGLHVPHQQHQLLLQQQQQQQLLQFQQQQHQHGWDAKSSPRRSPLPLNVGTEHELPNSEDMAIVTCGGVVPACCIPCSSSTVVTVSSATASVVTTSVVTAVAASSSSSPPHQLHDVSAQSRGGTLVQLRPKRPGYLNPKDSDSAFSSPSIRRRSAEVSAMQHHPANQPGHRRSNSSGTLTSLTSGEALPPPAPPASPAAGPPSALARPADRAGRSPPRAAPGGESGSQGGGGGRGGGADGSVEELEGGCAAAEGPGEDELGRFWELLDPDTQPIMPIPGCPESQKIFEDHKEMARKYLVLQQEIYNLCQQKKELSDMVAEEKHKQQVRHSRYQDKIMQLQHKREILRNNHSRLRAQLDKIQGKEANMDVSNSSTTANPASSSARHHHYPPTQTPHRSSHYTSTHHLPSGLHQQQPPPHPSVLPLQDLYYPPRHLRQSPQQPPLVSPSSGGQLHASPLPSPSGGSLYPPPGPPRQHYHSHQQQQQLHHHQYHHQSRHQYGSDLAYASPPD